MNGPVPQGNAAPGATKKGGKGGLIVILALVAVAGFVVVAGVGTVLFLKRDAIMAKFKKTEVVQNNGTETEPTNVSPQPSSPAPEVVKPNPPAPKPVEPSKPVVKPVEPPKPPVATVPKETIQPKPADVKPATLPKQETVEFGLADQTEKPNTATTANTNQPATTQTNPSPWKRFANGAKEFGQNVAKDTKEFGQNVAHHFVPSTQNTQPEAQQTTQPEVQQTTQPEVQQPVQPVVQQPVQPVPQVTQPVQPVAQQGTEVATLSVNGFKRMGSFDDGGVVLFGANDGRNTSFFKELSKNEEFKAVGFQEASKNVQQWCDQISEIQGNGPAFIIVSISVNRNDFQFKKMMPDLVKNLPSNNAAILLATANEDVVDEVRKNCDAVGLFYRKWGSNKELVAYIVGLKKELGW